MKVFKEERFDFYTMIAQYFMTVLIEKAGKVKMNVNSLRNLCGEIYKTINKLNPEFMNNIFKVKENKRLVREQYKLNLETHESIWIKGLEQPSFSDQNI